MFHKKPCAPTSPFGRPSGPPCWPAFVGTPSGGFSPFANNAGTQPQPPAPTPGPVPIPPGPPPNPLCKDTLSSVPFTIPFSTTVNVSGGGLALSNAVVAAGPNTRLLIMDSLAYTQFGITGKTNLTIDVMPGQTPSITTTPGPGSSCIQLQAGNSGIAIKKMTFIGSGNVNVLSIPDNGLILGAASDTGMASIDRVLIEDCTFSEPAATVATGVPGIQLDGTDGSQHSNLWIHRCTFRNNAAGAFAQSSGYGACTTGGFTNVWIQNCLIIRDDAVVARAASNMRGYVIKPINMVMEDCAAFDLGTAGSNEAFKHAGDASFGSAIGPSVLRNCVAYNCQRWYRINLGGATMTVTDSVGANDIAGIGAGQTLVQQTAGSLTFQDNVMSGGGSGTAFTAAVAVENHNDVFNFAALGKVLDPTDLTIDPQFLNVGIHQFVAKAPALQAAASDGGAMGVRYPGGEPIIWCGV